MNATRIPSHLQAAEIKAPTHHSNERSSIYETQCIKTNPLSFLNFYHNSNNYALITPISGISKDRRDTPPRVSLRTTSVDAGLACPLNPWRRTLAFMLPSIAPLERRELKRLSARSARLGCTVLHARRAGTAAPAACDMRMHRTVNPGNPRAKRCGMAVGALSRTQA